MFERLLSVKEFARRLGEGDDHISPATVHSWLSLGRFGLERTKVGSRTFLRESELYKVIHHRSKSPTRRRSF
jgi:hypothetical protein